MKYEFGAFLSDTVREKLKYWDRKSAPLPVYLAQVPHGLAWDLNQGLGAGTPPSTETKVNPLPLYEHELIVHKNNLV
jgi:hypothetical protein